MVLRGNVRLEDRYMVLVGEVDISGQTKLEAKFEICFSIDNVEREGGLSGPHGPDIDHLLEAPEEEGLFRHGEGGSVHILGTGENCHVRHSESI